MMLPLRNSDNLRNHSFLVHIKYFYLFIIMNIYLLSFIEIVLYGTIAYFLGNNIDLYTEDDTLVNLNYMFWGYLIALSVLINFELYIHFGSVFIIGLLFLGIYIYKVVRVITFVDLDMNMYFWMLFIIFFIPLLVLIVTKKMLIGAYRSNAPRGEIGQQGQVGIIGESYFIESLPDKAYVLIINGLEDFLKEVYDFNGVDYNPHERLLNNFYLKENIKRITTSTQFLSQIMPNVASGTNDIECAFPSSNSGSNMTSQVRRCYSRNNRLRGDETDVHNRTCSYDSDCYSSERPMPSTPAINLDNVDTNPVYNLFIEIRYWIILILENSCDDDKRLKKMLKIPEYYSLQNFNQSIKSDFKSLSTSDKQTINSINYYRMNSLVGRKFIQSNFLNHTYWENKEFNNPFTEINKSIEWKWGTIGLDECGPDPTITCGINTASNHPKY